MNLNTPSKRIGALLLVTALIMAVTYVLQWEYYDSRPMPAYSGLPDLSFQFQTSREQDQRLAELAQSIADESKYERMLDSFLGGIFIYWFVGIFGGGLLLVTGAPSLLIGWVRHGSERRKE
jgi:hypothetical protein